MTYLRTNWLRGHETIPKPWQRKSDRQIRRRWVTAGPQQVETTYRYITTGGRKPVRKLVPSGEQWVNEKRRAKRATR